MKKLDASSYPQVHRPLRVMQYGEGNFLRAFVDYMLDIANEKGDFNGDIMLVKPISFGNAEAFEKQDGRYTVLLRGLKDGQRVEESRVITSVRGCLDAYTEYERYAALAKEASLRFVVSNTTEAGIVLDESDDFALCPPRTFPGKLCKFLFERAEHFGYAMDKGLIMLPVELIDDNGIMLKRCVLRLAEIWGLGKRFIQWLNKACVFTSTLVDRIVTGYPKDEAPALWEKLGYEDRLLVTAEPFALWVIEADKDISGELPLDKAGLPVIFTDNQKPYKQRKVRILNGAHTSFVPMAFLMGHDDVLGAMGDKLVRGFMEHTIHDEVIPTLDLPKADLESFAEAVTQRFNNPYIHHRLLSLCLNSVSKWRARCLPSLTVYLNKQGKLPEHLAFSLAALAALYRDGELKDGALHKSRDGMAYQLQDDESVLQFFDGARGWDDKRLAHAFLEREDFFGEDLTRVPSLAETVENALRDIREKGMRAAVEERFGG